MGSTCAHPKDQTQIAYAKIKGLVSPPEGTDWTIDPCTCTLDPSQTIKNIRLIQVPLLGVPIVDSTLNVVNVTPHECIELEFYCFNCQKMSKRTIEFGKTGKDIVCGYYATVYKTTGQIRDGLTFKEVKMGFLQMSDYYDMRGRNCVHWSRELFELYKKTERGKRGRN